MIVGVFLMMTLFHYPLSCLPFLLTSIYSVILIITPLQIPSIPWCLSLSVVLLGNPQLCVNSTSYFLLIILITYRAQVCIQHGLATLQHFSWMGQVLTSCLRSLCVIFLLKLQTPAPLLLPSTSDLTCHFNKKEMKPLAGVPSLPASEPTLLPSSLPPL